MFRWHQPHPSSRRVLLLGTAGAGLLSLAVVSLVVQNYDVGVLAGVLGRLRSRRPVGDVHGLQAPLSVRVGAAACALVHRRRVALGDAVDRALDGVTDSPAFLDGEFTGTAGFAGTDLAADSAAAALAALDGDLVVADADDRAGRAVADTARAVGVGNAPAAVAADAAVAARVIGPPGPPRPPVPPVPLSPPMTVTLLLPSPGAPALGRTLDPGDRKTG